VEQSILTSTKKILGIAGDYTAFDLDILTYINSAFSTLNQLGIGPEAGFMIEDAAPTWDSFIGTDSRLNSVKNYVYLSVRLIFDPPATSFAIEALNQQKKELEWRLNVYRESTAWVDPDPALPEDLVLDGGEP
jgi:hypothetical protein